MGILENIKEAVSLARKIDNMDLYRALLDSQGEVVDMMEDLRKKDEEIKRLEKAIEIKGKMIINHSAYYLMDDSENIIDGPFCTKCLDVGHITCRLVGTPSAWNTVQCQNCRLIFIDVRAREFIKTTSARKAP